MRFIPFLIVCYSLLSLTQARPTTGDYVGVYIPVLYKKSIKDQAESNLDNELIKHRTHLIYGVGIIQSTFLELGFQHNYMQDNESEYTKYLNQFDLSVKYFHSELEKYNTYGFGFNLSLMQTYDIMSQVKDTGYIVEIEVNYSFLIPFSESEDHYVQVRLIYPISSINRNQYTDIYKNQNIRIAVIYRYHF